MTSSFDIWRMLAGVAVFLLGIRFLEDSLQLLAGRKFKLFLKKQTSNKFKAIGGGALVTAVLQSSSIVSLMVLAFVGAGIITMNNALAVILGANLGTTATGWLIALLGFKINIESIALPLTGIAGIGFAVFNRQTGWFNWSRFLLGFSFLFVGLGYMKSGIEGLMVTTELQRLHYSVPIIYLLVGFFITSIIQSSSAMMAITLSALHVGAITLIDSMAVVLGAELGTTLKLFIASIKGLAAKKRVALGNFLFNSIVVALVMVFLSPLSRFVTEIININDPLIALVFFQTLVNIIGIILFFPFLNFFGRFLESRFVNQDDETMFIHKVNAKESTMALFAMEEETKHFLAVVSHYIMSIFNIQDPNAGNMKLDKKLLGHDIFEKYEHIKFLYGEIHSYSIKFQKTLSADADNDKLDRLISAVRNGMYAAKSFKDAIPDKDQLLNSSNDVKYEFYNLTKAQVEKFCNRVQNFLLTKDKEANENLISLYKSVTGGYNDLLHHLYREGTSGRVNETEITTMLNFNREIITGFKSLLFGVKDFLLDKEQSRFFDESPGFIR